MLQWKSARGTREIFKIYKQVNWPWPYFYFFTFMVPICARASIRIAGRPLEEVQLLQRHHLWDGIRPVHHCRFLRFCLRSEWSRGSESAGVQRELNMSCLGYERGCRVMDYDDAKRDVNLFYEPREGTGDFFIQSLPWCQTLPLLHLLFIPHPSSSPVNKPS